MSRPNLFKYATSELSQDAFLCWIASWSDPSASIHDNQLSNISIKFLKDIFLKHKKEFPQKIEKVEVIRQYKNIDILIAINDTFVIPIESKAGTKEHSNQLAKYVKIIQEEGWKIENTLPTYIQTGVQCDYNGVEASGFIPFLRNELIEVLKDHNQSNQIINDYFEHLQSIENAVTGFAQIKVQDWGWYAWQGFYSCLQKKILDGKWAYVPNPRGGFLGFWWYWHGDDECEQYLQLEQEKLCFKISVDTKDRRSDLKLKWHNKILESSTNSLIKLIKPVLRNGQYMTVCVASCDYRQTDSNGILNFDNTVAFLEEAQSILNKAVQI